MAERSLHRFPTGTLELVREHPEFEGAQLLSMDAYGSITSMLSQPARWNDRYSGRLVDFNSYDLSYSVRGLPSSPPLPTEVIYMPTVIEGSSGRINSHDFYFRNVEKEILADLPKVEGVVWSLGSAAELVWILHEGYKITGQFALPDAITVTRDRKFNLSDYHNQYRSGLRLAVGRTSESGIRVETYDHYRVPGDLGVYALGFPADISTPYYNLLGESY